MASKPIRRLLNVFLPTAPAGNFLRLDRRCLFVDALRTRSTRLLLLVGLRLETFHRRLRLLEEWSCSLQPANLQVLKDRDARLVRR